MFSLVLHPSKFIQARDTSDYKREAEVFFLELYPSKRVKNSRAKLLKHFCLHVVSDDSESRESCYLA